MSITFRQLLESLKGIPDERLDDDVTIVDPSEGEAYELLGYGESGKGCTLLGVPDYINEDIVMERVQDGSDALDTGHPYIILKKFPLE